MSYNSKNFSVMAYANGFTLWNYSTADTLTEVKTANYLNEAAPFVRPGDMILTVASNTAAAIETAVLAVSKIDNGVVTIAAVA